MPNVHIPLKIFHHQEVSNIMFDLKKKITSDTTQYTNALEKCKTFNEVCNETLNHLKKISDTFTQFKILHSDNPIAIEEITEKEVQIVELVEEIFIRNRL